MFIYERLYKGEKELTFRSPFGMILPYLPLLHVRAFSGSCVVLIQFYAFYCKHMESMSPFLNQQTKTMYRNASFTRGIFIK